MRMLMCYVAATECASSDVGAIFVAEVRSLAIVSERELGGVDSSLLISLPSDYSPF